MIRNMIEERGVGYETDFRWRGGNVSRIEGLSDAQVSIYIFSECLFRP